VLREAGTATASSPLRAESGWIGFSFVLKMKADSKTSSERAARSAQLHSLTEELKARFADRAHISRTRFYKVPLAQLIGRRLHLKAMQPRSIRPRRTIQERPSGPGNTMPEKDEPRTSGVGQVGNADELHHNGRFRLRCGGGRTLRVVLNDGRRLLLKAGRSEHVRGRGSDANAINRESARFRSMTTDTSSRRTIRSPW